jgi:hypothetical protein
MKRVLLLTLACLVAVTSMAIAGTSDDARFALHRKATTTKDATTCGTYNPNVANLACNGFTTTAPGLGYSLVYIVVGHGPTVGINGVSFGIDYSGRRGQATGIDPAFNSFTLCADGLPFYNGIDLDGNGTVDPLTEEFPAPRGGARVTWVSCVANNIGGFGTQAVVGALKCYAYSPDQLAITGNNNLGPVAQDKELSVASCDGTETFLFEVQAGNPTPRSVFPPFAWYSLMGRVDFGVGTGFNPCLIVPARETTWGKIKDLYHP